MKEKASIDFRLRKVDERRNCLLDKKKDLMSEKYKKTCRYLSFVEHLLILVSKITGCVSTSAFLHYLLFLLVLRVLQ